MVSLHTKHNFFTLNPCLLSIWFSCVHSYYFGNASSSIQEALNASQIVDTDRLIGRVNTVLTGMPGNHTYR
jgi:hypothetical protein